MWRKIHATMKKQFTSSVNGEIESGGYTTDLVIKIDETNIVFDITDSMTMADEGAKTVSIRTSCSSSRCTVLLGVTLSGIKLHPFIIFKGSPLRRLYREWTCAGTQYLRILVFAVQQKAWINYPKFLDWIDKVWKAPNVSTDGQVYGPQNGIRKSRFGGFVNRC
jgi:hypothetical protein